MACRHGDDRSAIAGRTNWLHNAAIGLALYGLTAAVVVFTALVAAPKLIEPCVEFSGADFSDLGRLAAWDGQWYAQISRQGYSYDPKRPSSVAFYPAYPLAARGVMFVTGLPAEAALLLVSHVSLLAATVVFAAYANERFCPTTAHPFPGPLRKEAGARGSAAAYSPWVLALFPTTFYFRMALTESLFLLLAVLTLYGIQRRWPLLVIAAIVGLATATKLVGAVLALPLFLETWKRSPSVIVAFSRMSVLLPIALWGISTYVAYQAWVFDAPFAFVQTQDHWTRREFAPDAWSVFAGLVTFEPVRAVYDPQSICYWARRPPSDNPWLNMVFANPLYFQLTGALLLVGAWRKWLTRHELLIGALLWFIPYALQGYRTCMVSQARFASVVFPAYLVIGQMLARLPTWLSAAILVFSGSLMVIYAAMFSSWYWYY
jgi:hypothetical protein